MDVHMPALNGFEAVQRIMSSVPTPILVLTEDPNSADAGWCFEALSLGALELLPKPDLDQLWNQPGHLLCERIRLLSGVSVVHHPRPQRVVPTLVPSVRPHGAKPGCVAIGASTGGPGALAQVLAPLGHDFPMPIVVVQHLAHGFAQHLATWLNDSSQLEVLAVHRKTNLLPGKVYLAPDDRHLVFESRDRVVLRDEPQKCHYRPSADVLFHSAATRFGADAIGVILTGMGRDGAEGLLELRRAGAFTIAQSATSCAVDGMPKAARDLGAASCVLPPSQIGQRLVLGAQRILNRNAAETSP